MGRKVLVDKYIQQNTAISTNKFIREIGTHLVVVEIKESKDTVIAETLGEGSAHLVEAQIQIEEAVEGGPVRDGTGQVVLVQRKVAQVLALAEAEGDAAL